MISRVTVSPERRLAILAMAKFAVIGLLLGTVIGVGMSLDGETKWSILFAPPLFAALGACTLGAVVAISWWLFPGRVTYSVGEGCLTAKRGKWVRRRVPLARISKIDFNEDVEPVDLIFTGWFGFTSAMPQLLITLNSTEGRWDPSNGAVEHFPRILLAGRAQARALHRLRQSAGLGQTET